MLAVSSVGRGPLAEKGVNTLNVATEGSQGQRGPACLVPLVHICLPLQQHLEGLSVAMVSLQERPFFGVKYTSTHTCLILKWTMCTEFPFTRHTHAWFVLDKMILAHPYTNSLCVCVCVFVSHSKV